MPGVIMDHGSRNGSHTNHDRNQRPNGINGTSHTTDKMQDKGKARTPQPSTALANSTMSNGLNGKLPEGSRHVDGENEGSRSMQMQVNQLPDEIAHIAENYFPLSTLISRLAQKTHADILSTVQELGQMPTPASAVNCTSSHQNATEDMSQENVNKKLRLLNFATSTHEAWTKALVITGWSRKAEEVTHLIDLRIHLEAQKQLYTDAINSMAENKRALHNFRLPNPDLKTALAVLTTGKASWMPDLNYIQPPPLTAKEVLKSLEKLNTLLSIRLNLHDYETIPLQFKDFTIQSGRATFRVPGEFEIDLTIADEELESQYWFIDFRFLFHPSSRSMSPGNRGYLENRVNEVLHNDGLSGCYKHLHELILTYKIAEFRRQAVTLARSTYIDTLRVEPLNRSISIQYWLNRYSDIRNSKGVLIKATKSWIILGVHSGRRKDGRPDPKATSRLFLRWFRESKEVKDVEIPFDVIEISAESLLKTVIAKHIEYILTSIYDNLASKPLYANRDLEMSLHILQDSPADSELKIQLTAKDRASMKIDPVSGRFVLSPMSRTFANYEAGLNDRIQDPVKEGHMLIERLRLSLITEDITSHGLTVGWNKVIKPEHLRFDKVQQFAGKDHSAVIWFRRFGWVKDWYLAVSQNMSGEKWFLVKTALVPAPIQPNNLDVVCAVKLPINTPSPEITYSFLSTLNIFAAGVISHYTNMKLLHAKRVHYAAGRGRPSKSVTLPSIYVRLSDVLPSKNKLRTGNSWAKDIMRIDFQGVETVQQELNGLTDLNSPVQSLVIQMPAVGNQPPGAPAIRPFSASERCVLVTEAQMIVPLPQALLNINKNIDKDIVFNAKNGSFAIRLHSRVGESVVPVLIERMVRVERLVEFVRVLDHHKETLNCEMVSLGKIVFTYRNTQTATGVGTMEVDATSDMYRATVDFSAENHMALIFEKGNPHLRIVDALGQILNGSQGLHGTATFLPLTLPVLRGLDAIEAAWFSDDLSAKGEVFVNVRASDSYLVRYHLANPSLAADAISTARKVTFEVKLQHRKGIPWWYIRRTDGTPRNRPEDTLDGSLKALWNSSGSGWQGMSFSGVAQGSGTETLLVKVDEIVRKFALSGQNLDLLVPAHNMGPVSQKQAPAPNSRQQQQQRPQQPTPNQSQTQSQGRNSAHKREVVEID